MDGTSLNQNLKHTEGKQKHQMYDKRQIEQPYLTQSKILLNRILPSLNILNDMTYRIKFREGNGTPLQYSCLEDPVDRGAWQAAVHGVAGSQTR